MKRIYQTEWQKIQFSDFAKLSSKELAGPEFYQRFYEEFFRRYKDWGQLASAWRKDKELWAEFVLARIGNGAKVLSVGCGLGAMEHYMRVRKPEVDLFIHEVASSAWHWVGKEFAKEREFLGLIPECLPDGIKFDLVYCATVDYALDDDALVGLLTTIRSFLKDEGGQCLLLSASFQDGRVKAEEVGVGFLRRIKAFGGAVLDFCRLRSRGQFWGWCRNQDEYRALMRRAGYREIEDGFIIPEKCIHYWIAGR
jgi:SAM-dependent methyltransferase